MTSLDDTEAIHPRLTKASRLTSDVPRTTLDTPATGEDRWGCSLGTLARMGGQGQSVRARKSAKLRGATRPRPSKQGIACMIIYGFYVRTAEFLNIGRSWIGRNLTWLKCLTNPRHRTVMPRVALRYAQSVAAVCWQQAASKGYLVYL